MEVYIAYIRKILDNMIGIGEIIKEFEIILKILPICHGYDNSLWSFTYLRRFAGNPHGPKMNTFVVELDLSISANIAIVATSMSGKTDITSDKVDYTTRSLKGPCQIYDHKATWLSIATISSMATSSLLYTIARFMSLVSLILNWETLLHMLMTLP